MDTTVRTQGTAAATAESGVSASLVQQAIAGAMQDVTGPVVLAVSGGRDSMALMFAMAAWARERVAAVATFDHGTGSAASEAAGLVAAEARRLGLNVVRERARALVPSEAAWRDARWMFLRRVAGAFRARVATAHTRDDHLETVVLRLLRGTGVRGLAALAAPSPHVRPWLPLARRDVAEWAAAERVPFVDDPSNQSRRYRRVRVRHDLLPALESVHPGFGDAMLAIAASAAIWRHEVEALVELQLVSIPMHPGDAGLIAPSTARANADDNTLRLSVSGMRQTTDDGRAVLWPAAMARAGVTIDRHALAELLRFSHSDRIGAELRLAGGCAVRRVRTGGVDLFELRGPARRAEPRSAAFRPGAIRATSVPGPWRLVEVTRTQDSEESESRDAEAMWHCMLPRSGPLSLRHWNAGDRIRTAGAPAGRRVAKYLSEARIPPLDRPGWPVVLWESDIVWIPGVCRSVAAPNRPGWSDLIWYRCEREHG